MLQLNTSAGSQGDEQNLFESPLELLLSCHEKILHFSSALQQLVQTLAQQGWTAELEKTADMICRYFTIAGPEHHLDEEKHLFPALIAIDPELTKPETLELVQALNQLIKEHVETDLLWESLNIMLSERSQDFATLKELAEQFAADMQEHVDIENNTIFPYAREHLSRQTFKKMGLAIARRRGINPEQLK
jgi:hemerythrin-like domain-containing protein